MTTQQRLCLACGAPFEAAPGSVRRYCSSGCRPVSSHSRRPKNLVTVPCAQCGKTFQRKAWEVEDRRRKGWALYCSVECRNAAKMGRKGVPQAVLVDVTCEMCGKVFQAPPHMAKKRRFCSLSCNGRAGGAKGGRARGNRSERQVSTDGYVHVYVPPEERLPGWEDRAMVQEHRLIIAHELGRALARDEQVHHINGDKLDNRRENLQLRQGNHGSGRLLRCRSCGSHDIEAVELG